MPADYTTAARAPLVMVVNVKDAEGKTTPLEWIVHTLQRNERIVWPHDDEIGLLVTEYNKMVNKVEENAALLAEKEISTDMRGIAVAVNGRVVPRGDWPDMPLKPGDTVEIVLARQGG